MTEWTCEQPALPSYAEGKEGSQSASRSAAAGRAIRRLAPWVLVFAYVASFEGYGLAYKATPSTDFPSFYWGAHAAFRDHASPYTKAATDKGKRGIFQPVYPYLYPPPSLLLFSPFMAFDDYYQARKAMLVVNHACVLAFLYVFLLGIMRIRVRQVLDGQFLPMALVLYVLMSFGVRQTIDHGQINLIVLVLVCLTWYAMKRDAPAWAVGAPLAAAILLKTYPILLVPLLLFRRRYAAAGWVVGLLLAVTAVAYAVLPQQVWGEWYYKVAPTGGYGKVPYRLFTPAATANQSINGFTSRLFLPKHVPWDEITPLWPSARLAALSGQALSAAVVAVSLGLAWWASRRRPQGSDPPAADPSGAGPVGLIDIEWSVGLIMTFLVAPLSWHHHLVFVLPGVIVAVRLMLSGQGAPPGDRIERLRWAPLILLAAVVIALQMPGGLPGRGLRYRAFGSLLVSRSLYAVVAIWVFLVWRGWRMLKSPATSPTERPEQSEEEPERSEARREYVPA